MTYDSIRPGEVWFDTNGRPIQAHGFQVVELDGIYYWYGENKERTKGGLFNHIWHWGVRCYTSTDLYNWEDRGLIIPPHPGDLSSPLHPTYSVDRPHIIYSSETGKFVAWLKVVAGVQAHFMIVMQADNFLGPYEFVRRVYNPLDMYTGDFTVVNDAATGEGYFIFDNSHLEIVTATLTPDRTAVTGEYSTHYENLLPPYTREAPTWFERDGINYLFTSGMSSYYANPSRVCSFTDWHGEYVDLGDPAIDDASNTTFYGQITSVLKVSGSGQYIAMADRWKPGPVSRLISRKYQGLIEKSMKNPPQAWRNPDRSPKSSELSGKLGRHLSNTSRARYVWLPIEWHDGKPMIRWQHEWRLSPASPE